MNGAIASPAPVRAGSFMQDPEQFTNDVLHFLEHVPAR
jgi:hypothetical protein